MDLPKFPDFAEVDLSLRETVRGYFAEYPLEASEYTFTNIFAFRSTYDFKLSLLKDNLIILSEAEPVSAFCPVGTSVTPEVLDELFQYLKQYNSDAFMERVPESFEASRLNDNRRYIIEEERDHFDYVYYVKDLIELKVRKYHDKKNKVNKYRNSYQ